MDFEKVLRLLDQFGVSVTLLIAGIIISYAIAKKVIRFLMEIFRDMQSRINELDDQLHALRDRFEGYLLKDNQDIKEALEKNQKIQQETTSVLDNSIEIIKLNTEAYERSRIAFEKMITYITEHTKLLQQWMQK